MDALLKGLKMLTANTNVRRSSEAHFQSQQHRMQVMCRPTDDIIPIVSMFSFPVAKEIFSKALAAQNRTSKLKLNQLTHTVLHENHPYYLLAALVYIGTEMTGSLITNCLNVISYNTLFYRVIGTR